MQALVAYLVQAPKRHRATRNADPVGLAEILCRGDVLLSEGNTRAAVLVKRITRSTWSHVSMYVGPLEEGQDPLCVVEADIAAGVRSIRLSELDVLQLRVLRPTGLNEAERDRLAEWVIGRVGSGYDFAHAWSIARKLLRLPLRACPGASPDAGSPTATRYICGSLLAHAFAQVGTSIAPAPEGASPLAATDQGSVTPGDFECASAFEVVA